MNSGIEQNRIDALNRNMKNEALAKRWPEICKALSNLPPTIGEVMTIKAVGPPRGFSYIPLEGRYQFGTIRKSAERSW